MVAKKPFGLYFDTATLYYRAFFAVPESITAPDGTPSGAVRGFLDMVSTLVKTYGADELVFAWDDDWRPQWRVDLVPSYKTHRLEDPADVTSSSEEVPDTLSPQIGAIADLIDAVGLSRIGEIGHEADDVLGALAKRAKGPIGVVTGDRDLYQLANDKKGHVVISITRGVKKLVNVTDEWLVESYGVNGAQYVDFATLRGDASDGLPGAKGIGEKTAAGLISSFGDLKKILAAAHNESTVMKPAVRSSLIAHEEYLHKARQVVTVRNDAVLPDSIAVPHKIKDLEALTELAIEWGVVQHVNRLLKVLNLGKIQIA